MESRPRLSIFLRIVAFRRGAMTVMVIAGVMLPGMTVVRCGSARTGVCVVGTLWARFGRGSPLSGKRYWCQQQNRQRSDSFHCKSPRIDSDVKHSITLGYESEGRKRRMNRASTAELRGLQPVNGFPLIGDNLGLPNKSDSHDAHGDDTNGNNKTLL
jgi:hypothetical protein